MGFFIAVAIRAVLFCENVLPECTNKSHEACIWFDKNNENGVLILIYGTHHGVAADLQPDFAITW